jgi:putative ABC transport system permease protein
MTVSAVDGGFKMKTQDFAESFSTSGGVALADEENNSRGGTRYQNQSHRHRGEIEDNEKVKVKADVYFADSCSRMFPRRFYRAMPARH